MENSTIATRLKAIIQHLGLSDSQFADQCDISRATLSLLLSGKNKKISDILLSQIHNTFPTISIIWLLFNEGSMTTKPENENALNFDSENEISDNEFRNEQINDTEEHEYSNLMPLNQIENMIKQSVDKAFESFIENDGFSFKKIIQGHYKRKVRSVTVYYDDSTFETFVPGV